MTTPAYQPTANILMRAINGCLKKHTEGGKISLSLVDEIILNYDMAKAGGWVDWENDIGRYLPMLRRWAQEDLP